MTLLHTPPPPFCKQQRNFQRNTIFQPSNIFQDSTSSNALHMTLLHTPPPPPTPPHPPSLYKNDLYGIASRLRVPQSSGEPPALSLYIYIYTRLDLYVYIFIYIYVYTLCAHVRTNYVCIIHAIHVIHVIIFCSVYTFVHRSFRTLLHTYVRAYMQV